MSNNRTRVLQISNMELSDGGAFYSSISTHLGYFASNPTSTYFVITNKSTQDYLKSLTISNNIQHFLVRKRSAKRFHIVQSVKICRKISTFDYIHFHGIFTNSNILPLLYCVCKKKKILWQPHGMLTEYDLNKHRIIKKMYLLFYRLVLPKKRTAILLSSSLEMNELSSRPFTDLQKRILNYPPTIEELFSFSEPSIDINGMANRFNVLFYGRISPKKRLDKLIYMVSELVVEIPNIQLVIVGATDRGGIEFIRLASQLIPGNFVYLGTVSSQTNRKTLFENMSVFCLPSDSENYALAAVEIAALGLPCIVSMHTGAFQPNPYPNVQVIDSQRMDLWKLALLELSKNSATKNVIKCNNHLAEWTRYSSGIIEFMG